MTDKVLILDTTLRDGEQSPGCSMHINEKLEIARHLERLHVNIIEAGFAAASPEDFASVEAIAKQQKNCIVTSLSRALSSDILSSYQAVRAAVSPRIHLFLATSPLHMQYKLKMTAEEVLARIKESVAYAKSLVDDVEFSAEDASRSELEFLSRAIDVAIQAGATTINLPDTVGYATPNEMSELFSAIRNNVPNIDKVILATHNHDDLGLATANSLAAVQAGARQVECTLCGIGERAGNTALEEIVMALKTRESFYKVTTSIHTDEIYRASKSLYNILGQHIPPNKAIVGANAFAHESGIHQHGVLTEKRTYEIMSPADIGIPENTIVLGKHSGKHAFSEHLAAMGYSLTEEQINQFFEKFKVLADKKKYVSPRDIEALIDSKLVSDVYGYQLQSFEIFASSGNTNTATIFLTLNGELKAMRGSGAGPADAAFNAINRITGHEFNLVDFSLHAITEGQDAQGEAVVKLELNGQEVIGRGLSLDIMEATILAYLSGINKLLKDEL